MRTSDLSELGAKSNICYLLLILHDGLFAVEPESTSDLAVQWPYSAHHRHMQKLQSMRNRRATLQVLYQSRGLIQCR